jgi:hypothetical protein
MSNRETKKQRLLRIVDLYRGKVKDGPVDLNEVAAWALVAGLVPVPVYNASPRAVDNWEETFAKVASEPGTPPSC